MTETLFMPWTTKEILDVFQQLLVPHLQADDPRAALAAQMTCSSWYRAFRNAAFPSINATLYGCHDMESFATWLRSHSNISVLNISTVGQDICGEAEKQAIKQLADSLPALPSLVSLQLNNAVAVPLLVREAIRSLPLLTSIVVRGLPGKWNFKPGMCPEWEKADAVMEDSPAEARERQLGEQWSMTDQ